MEEGNVMSYERPCVGKRSSSSFALEQHVLDWEGPNVQQDKGSSPAEAGGEGSCRLASCPVPGVKVFPFLSSPACPLQLGRRPAAGAAGLHRLSA